MDASFEVPVLRFPVRCPFALQGADSLDSRRGVGGNRTRISRLQGEGPSVERQPHYKETQWARMNSKHLLLGFNQALHHQSFRPVGGTYGSRTRLTRWTVELRHQSHHVPFPLLRGATIES